MLGYDEAIATVLQTLSPLPPVRLPLEQAAGLVLAEDAAARWAMPTADSSAMDGFAVRAETVAAGRPLPVVGFLPAGRISPVAVPAGRSVRIMTGAPLPEACDTIVPLEDVDDTGESIRIRQPFRAGQHVRRRGEEFHAGETVLTRGARLNSGELGLLAAAGVDEVRVHPRPTVALLVTGDELVELGREPVPGQVVNSNLYLIRGRLQEERFPVIELGTVGDRPEHLVERLEEGFAADLVLTTGGVSVGDRDHVRSLCDRLDMEVRFWKLAIKPGKPVLFATRAGKPFFGLPGNPAAAAATFEILVRPALRRLAGLPRPAPPRFLAALAAPVGNPGRRELFLWGTVNGDGDGPTFHPSARQGSGQTRSLTGFNALLPVPPGETAWEAGRPVTVMLVRLPE